MIDSLQTILRKRTKRYLEQTTKLKPSIQNTIYYPIRIASKYLEMERYVAFMITGDLNNDQH